MNLARSPAVPLATGTILLLSTLTNRLFFTPDLTLTQSRSDLLAVAASATLILHALTLTQAPDRNRSIPLSGRTITYTDPTTSASLVRTLEWAANALLEAIPPVQTVQISTSTRRVLLRQGLFREGVNEAEGGMMTPDGVVDRVARGGERVYVADTKVFPGWKQEFAFLPEECQAVLVVAIGNSAALVLGADKPRPFLATDFGWVQALVGRIEKEMSNTAEMGKD